MEDRGAINEWQHGLCDCCDNPSTGNKVLNIKFQCQISNSEKSVADVNVKAKTTKNKTLNTEVARQISQYFQNFDFLRLSVQKCISLELSYILYFKTYFLSLSSIASCGLLFNLNVKYLSRDCTRSSYLKIRKQKTFAFLNLLVNLGLSFSHRIPKIDSNDHRSLSKKNLLWSNHPEQQMCKKYLKELF